MVPEKAPLVCRAPHAWHDFPSAPSALPFSSSSFPGAATALAVANTLAIDEASGPAWSAAQAPEWAASHHSQLEASCPRKGLQSASWQLQTHPKSTVAHTLDAHAAAADEPQPCCTDAASHAVPRVAVAGSDDTSSQASLLEEEAFPAAALALARVALASASAVAFSRT
jgi:arylamine N-acetyltransferase